MGKRNKRTSKRKRQELLQKTIDIFGSLESLNQHLRKLKLEEVDSMEQGIKIILGLWLNIVDFVHGILNMFKNKSELIKYTIQTGKFFSKKIAKLTGLSPLLIDMF